MLTINLDEETQPSRGSLVRTRPTRGRGLPLMLSLMGLLLTAAPSRADYDLTFTTTGSPTVGGFAVGATVEFMAVGTTLKITLTNTTSTATRSQLLTGVFFDVTGGTIPTTSSYTTPLTVVTGGDHLYTTATTSTLSNPATPLDITGSYIFAQTHSGLGTTTGPPAIVFNQHFGLSATGDSPLFPANVFTKGGGSDDYAIFGTGTDLTANSFKTSFPLVEKSVTFTITNFNAGSGITNVVFPFGSAPGGSATGTFRAVPEPASLALVTLGGIAFVSVIRRRRRNAV